MIFFAHRCNDGFFYFKKPVIFVKSEHIRRFLKNIIKQRPDAIFGIGFFYFKNPVIFVSNKTRRASIKSAPGRVILVFIGFLGL